MGDRYLLRQGTGTSRFRGKPLKSFSDVTGNKDNNGIERHAWIDKFDVDTSDAYDFIATGAIASGEATCDSTEAFIRYLDDTDTTGRWDAAIKFTTVWATPQACLLYFGSNSYLNIMRDDNPAGNEIKYSLVVNGTSIDSGDTGNTLADNTYAWIALTYDGTDYHFYLDGTDESGAVAGDAPHTPCLGFYASVSQIVAHELNYFPNVSYTDSFGSDTSARYAQVAGTVTYNAGGTNLSLAAAASGTVKERLKHYQFGAGKRIKKVTLPAGGNATNGDYVNVKMCANGDLTKGYGAGLIRTAGKWNYYTVIDTTGTDSGTDSGIHDGDAFYVETDWDACHGVFYYYIYETAKPTTPTGTIYNATYNYGYTGCVANNANAGNAQTWYLDDIEIRGNLLIGRTNIPATESNFYFNEDCAADRSGRWSALYGTWTWDGATKITSTSATTSAVYRLNPFRITNTSESQTITFSFKNKESTSEGKYVKVLFGWDGRMASATAVLNGYEVFFHPSSNPTNTNKLLIRKVADGTGTTLLDYTACTFTDNVRYYGKIVWSTAGVISVYLDTVDGTTLVGTATADTTFTNGYCGLLAYSTTAALTNVEWYPLTIDGTRWYPKPMLRGGGWKGEYSPDGVRTNTATRFVEDFNQNSIAEYTQHYRTWTVDTNNGYINANGSTASLQINNLKFGTGVYGASYYFTDASSSYEHRLIFAWDGTHAAGGALYNCYYLTHAGNGVFRLRYADGAGSLTTIASGTTYAATNNVPYLMMVRWNRSTGAMNGYLYGANGVLLTTVSGTDTTLTSAYYTGILHGTVSTVKTTGIYINALESASTDGVAALVGGTCHGGLWDEATWAGVKFDKDYTSHGYFRSRAKYGLSTSTPSYKWYFKNNTHSRNILKSNTNTTSYSGTGAAVYRPVDERTLDLNFDDQDDEIWYLLTTDTASNTFPATYLTELNIKNLNLTPPIMWTDGNMAETCGMDMTYSLAAPKGNLATTINMGTVGYHLNAVEGRVTAPSLNPYITSGTVSREFINKMYSATFEFAGKDTGYNIYSGSYFKHVQFTIPDYSGANNCVFVGFFPGSTTTVSPGADRQSLTAYDYGYYLSNQPLEFNDLVLLTPTDQAAEKKWQLYFNNGTSRMNIGDRIVGGTSGDGGTVIETYGLTSGHIIMKGVTGSSPYFTDTENLKRCGSTVAKADGTTTDVTGTITDVYPDDWIKSVLGGTDWLKKTGIEPYKINNTATVWDVTIPSCTMTWEETQSKMSAIEDVCQKLKWIFLVKWRYDATNSLYRPCAYFVDEADIDDAINGLDLPATVTITKPNKYLTKPIVIDQKGDERVNKVVVKCQGFDGTWYTSADVAGTTCSSGVISGDEIPIIKKEINPNITTQDEADDRAADLYAYYQSQIVTYRATFTMRSDFQLLQKLTFSGYDATEIPDGTYRIIGIEYRYAAQGNSKINEQTVTLIDSSKFASYLKLSRVFTGSIWEIQKLIDFDKKKQKTIETATVTAVAGSEITVIDDAGIVRKARDAT